MDQRSSAPAACPTSVASAHSDGLRDVGVALDMDRQVMIGDSRKLRLRPIRTDDAQALVNMGLRSTPEDLRLRFFSPVRPMMGPLTAILTDFDRDRHIAVAAYDPAAPEGDQDILGVVRLILTPDKTEGEFAIMVRSDQAGHGLGHCLMAQMLTWARERALTRVRAEIMYENKRMLRLAREFGAVVQPQNQDFRIVQVVIDLTGGPCSPAIDPGVAPT